MSTVIDKKVVEMSFDNKKFESNIKTSLSSIQKLKSSLNFNGVAKGFTTLTESARKCDMTPLGNAVETIKVKFSAFEVLAITALTNIANKAVDTGERLVRSLTIDQVTAGWEKYNQKTASVQTIMNATGKSIDEVNGYLEKLMWFSDETSYGFTDMTQSLGQLTSAGADIENIIPMITGIANATAFAGKGANEFSRAIYNINQSYGAGYLQLMDWKSLELAGIAGKQLKQIFIEVAEQQGKIKKGQVTLGNFSQTLKDKWADTSVMEKAFGKFSQLSDEVYKLVDSGVYDTAAEAIEALSGKYDSVAERAFKAAQEAKTFSEAIDATKDAVSSGWMTTFEIIFGNYEESKELWTELCGHLWDIFASSGEQRNEMLSSAMTSSWSKLTSEINEAGISTEVFDENVGKVLKNHGFDVDLLTSKYGSLEKVFQDGIVPASYLRLAIDDLNKSLANLDKVQNVLKKGSKGDEVREAQKALKQLGQNLGEFGDKADGIDGVFGEVTKNAVKAFQAANDLKETGIIDEKTLAALKEASANTKLISSDFDDLLSTIKQKGGKELIIESLNNSLDSLKKALTIVAHAWENVFYPGVMRDDILELRAERIRRVAEAVNNFSKSINDWVSSSKGYSDLKDTLKGLFSILDIIATFVKSVFSTAISTISRLFGGAEIDVLGFTASIGRSITACSKWIKENEFFTTVLSRISDVIVNTVTSIREWVKSVAETETAKTIFKAIGDFARTAGENISAFFLAMPSSIAGTIASIREWVGEISKAEKVQVIFKAIGDFARTAGENISKYFSTGASKIREFIDRVKKLNGINLSNISTVFKDFKDNVLSHFINFDGVFDSIKNFAQNLWPSITEFFDNAGTSLVEFWRKVKDTVGKIAEKFEAASQSIRSFFEKITPADIARVAAIAGLVLYLIQIYKFIGAMTNLGDSMASVMSGIGDSLNESFTDKVKDFAISVGIIAASIYMLAKLEWDEAWKAAVAVGAIMVVLAGIQAAMTVLSSKFGAIQAIKPNGFLTGILGLCAGVLILVKALKELEGITWDDAVDRLKILGAMLAGLTGAAILLSLSGQKLKGVAAVMVVFAASLWVLSKTLKSENFPELTEGIANPLLKAAVAIAVIAAAVSFISKKLKPTSTGKVSKGLNLIGVAGVILSLVASVLVISKAIEQLGSISDTAILIQGGIVVGIILVAITGIFAAFTAISNHAKSDTIKGIGGVLISIAAALAIFGAAVVVLGALPWEVVSDGLWSLVVILGSFAIAVAACGTTDDKTWASILSMTVAIAAIVAAILILKDVADPDLIGKVHSIALVILAIGGAVALAGWKGSGNGALGILAAAAAIAVLAGSIWLLQDIPWQDMIVKMGILVGAILLLSVIAGLLGKSGVGFAALLAIAAVVVSFGASCWLAGEGMKSFAEGIGILSQNIPGLIAQLVPLAQGLLEFVNVLYPCGWELVAVGAACTILGIGLTAIAVAAGIVALAAVALAAAFYIAGAAVKLIAEGLILLGDALVKLVQDVTPLQSSMDAFRSVMISMGTSIAACLIQIADGALNLGGSVAVLALGVLALGAALIVGAAGVALLGVGFIVLAASIALISGAILLFAESLQKSAEIVHAVFSSFVKTAETSGEETGKGFLGGILSTSKAIGTAGSLIGSVLIGALKSVLRISSPSKEGFDTGENYGMATASGVESTADAVGKSGEGLGQKLLEGFGKIFPSLSKEGENAGDSFMSGVTSDIASKFNAETLLGDADTSSITSMLSGLGMESGNIFAGEFSNSISQLTVGDGGNLDLTGMFGSLGTESANEFSSKLGEGLDVEAMMSQLSGGENGDSGLASMFGDLGIESGDIFAGGFGEGFDVESMMSQFAGGENGNADITQMFSNLGMDGGNMFSQGFGESVISSIDTEAITEAGGGTVDAFVSGIDDKSDLIREKLVEVMSNALEAIKDKYSDFEKKGKYLVEGFAEGISKNTKLATDATIEMVKKVIKAAAEQLDERSPSRVFFGIGAFAGEGLVNGLNSYGDKVYSAGSIMGENARQGLSAAIARISELIDSGIDTEPTIRPVLDLTDIKSGSNALSKMTNGWNGISLSGSYDLATSSLRGMQSRAAYANDNSALLEQCEKLIAAAGQNGPQITNEFHITGDNPKEIANEVSRIIQQQVSRRNAALGQR